MIASLLAAAALLAPSLRAQSFEALPGAMPSLAPVRLAYEESEAAARAARDADAHQVVPLPHIRNNNRLTRLTFDANGRTVHVFGGKSRNTEEWFVGFAEEGGPVTLYKGSKALHYQPPVIGWLGLKADRHLIVTLNGALFDVQLLGQALGRLNSPLVIKPVRLKAGKSAPAHRRPSPKDVEPTGAPSVSFTVQQIIDAVYDTGWPLTIGGRSYRVFYSDDFDESSDGEFQGWTGDRSITFAYRDAKGSIAGYHQFESEIPADFVGVFDTIAHGGSGAGEGEGEEVKPGSEDGKKGPKFGLQRLANGELDLWVFGR